MILNKKILIIPIAFLAVLLLFGTLAPKVFAASSGPLGPGTIATDNGSGGTKDWTNPNNAKVEDGTPAKAIIGEIAGSPECLDPDTPIFTQKGNKAIKDLKAGDMVYSYNPVLKQIELKRVGGVFNRSISYYDNKYYHIYFNGGNIKATYNHLFYVNGETVMAKDLKAGDELFDINGNQQKITGIIIEENYTDDVWDLSIEDNHNFFANGVLTHNAGVVYDHRVRIIKGGAIGSTDKASGTAWPGSLAYTTYGGASDLWGETWTASDINASTFGVAISAYGSGFSFGNYTSYYLKATNFSFSIPDGSTIDGITAEIKKQRYPAAEQQGLNYAYIDYIRITVSYTPADATNPTVSTLSPADNAPAVGINDSLVITFSEAVDAETGNINLYKTSGDVLVQAFDVTADITGTGTAIITANPTSSLLGETDYYVKIDATAFDDAAGNSFAGIADATTWNFTTADIANPTVSTLSPADNAPAVGINDSLVITFSEAVDAETGNINLYKTSGDVLVQAFDVTADITGTGTAIITANPTSSLLGETDYYVKIDATAFDDAAGNSFAGIADATTWNFTTADITNPTISGGLPSGEQSAGTTSITMSVTTNENATCKYSSISGTAFALMTAFTTTGTANHSTLISGLSNGSSYSYYVLCQDSSNNESTETTISFSVASPSGSGGLPAGAYNSPSVPTGGFKVKVNQGTSITSKGTSITSNRIVNLNFNAGADIKKMAISLTGDFNDASQEDYSPTKQIDLCSKLSGLVKNPTCPDGQYTIYVKFYTYYGRASDIVSTKINLVTTPQFSKPTSIFTKDLRLGSRDNQVKILQQFLNQNGFKLVNRGAGSPGNETDYFGKLTQVALTQFQEANKGKAPGLVNEKGYLGLITRQFINSSANATTPATPIQQTQNSPSAIFTTPLYKGMQSEDVRRLQKLLATKPEIYPEGKITGYFGILTEKAVQKFQLQYRVVNSESDPGFGYVGPKTRAKLQEVFGN